MRLTKKTNPNNPNRWCPWRGSNARPPPYQGGALPLSHMGIDTGLSTEDKPQRPNPWRPRHNPKLLERETGIEPVSLAWKAKVLPLNYSRTRSRFTSKNTSLAWWRRLDSNQRRRKPTDLQSAPFSHSGTPPRRTSDYSTEPSFHRIARWPCTSRKRLVALKCPHPRKGTGGLIADSGEG
jgi:hypothetical protein